MCTIWVCAFDFFFVSGTAGAMEEYCRVIDLVVKIECEASTRNAIHKHTQEM